MKAKITEIEIEPGKTNDALEREAAFVMADGSVVEAKVEHRPMTQRDADVHNIATAFAAGLRKELGKACFAEVRRLNATPEYGRGVCASHEFCDANMVMLPAFEKAMGRPFDVESVEDQKLWNDAWNDAHRNYLIKAEPAQEA